MSTYICQNCGNRCGMYGHVNLSVPFGQTDFRCEKPDNLEEKLAMWKKWFEENPDER
jgi:hypothetical protein